MNIYATSIIHTTPTTSLSILLLLNAVGVPGRIIPALLADRFLGPLNTFIILCLTGSLLVLLWLTVRTFSALIVFAVIYGMVNSGVQGISLGSMSSLTKDLSKMGTRVGMVLSVIAFANFSGAPIAGALIDGYGGQFTGFCIFGGTAMAFGVCILMCARCAESGWVWRRKM
jgi:MFS family permease